MATEDDHIEIEDEENNKENKGKKVAKHDDGAADLEKVTDHVDEVEISAQSMGDAMRIVNDKKTKEKAEKQLIEKELSKVKINKEDVDLIVQEMEIPRNLAERKLREHKGNVVDALVDLTN